jgi:hypothetical protein
VEQAHDESVESVRSEWRVELPIDSGRFSKGRDISGSSK